MAPHDFASKTTCGPISYLEGNTNRSHKLYKLGYELVMEKKSKVKIDYNLSTGITSYFKSLPMQYYFVKSFLFLVILLLLE